MTGPQFRVTSLIVDVSKNRNTCIPQNSILVFLLYCKEQNKYQSRALLHTMTFLRLTICPEKQLFLHILYHFEYIVA